MTKIQKLRRLDSLLVEASKIIQELIATQINRQYAEQERYEQQKAIGQCVAAKKCKNTIVPQHTMCSYHLNKAAENSRRRDAKAPYRER